MHVQDVYIKLLAHEPVDHLVMLCLDNQNRLISEETLSFGTIQQLVVYPNEIMNAASELYARSVTLAHNHPSDELRPPCGDIAFTVIQKSSDVHGSHP